MSIRLVIVDDQGMVRAGFRSLLADEPDFEVVGEAGNGEDAVEVVSRLLPDVTLMDIRMPVLDGIAATRELVAAAVPTKVLVLTTFDLDEYVFEALRAGASGFFAGARGHQARDRRVRTTPRPADAYTRTTTGRPDAT
jgi:DNA-binding NarL/FixJ family response regulator